MIRYFLILGIILTLSGFPSYGQLIEINPDPIDFGSLTIGYNGEPEAFRTVTIQNTSDNFVTISNIAALDTTHFIVVSSDARLIWETLRYVYHGVLRFRDYYREDPGSLEDLIETGHYELDEDIGRMWTIRLIGSNPVTAIEGISTREHPSGAGCVVWFDTQSAQLRGRDRYIEMINLPESIQIAAGQSYSFEVMFSPDDTGEINVALGVSASTHNEQESYEIKLSGSGYFHEGLDISVEHIDFGLVGTNDRAVYEFTMDNTSKYAVECDFSDSFPFCLSVQFLEPVHNRFMTILHAIDAYNRDFGEDPSSVEELIWREYLKRDNELRREFTISLISQNPIMYIEAISTANHEPGAGHVLIYETQTRRFRGYGMRENTFIAPLSSRRYVASFMPTELREFSDSVEITVESDFRIQHTYQRTIHFTGEGSPLFAPDNNSLHSPEEFNLQPAYPNPFNNMTIIPFNLTQPGLVKLEVFNFRGQLISTLANRQFDAGLNRIKWNANEIGTGVYLVKMSAKSQSEWQKVVLVR